MKIVEPFGSGSPPYGIIEGGFCPFLPTYNFQNNFLNEM